MGVYNHVILLKMLSRQSLISTCLECHGDSSVKRKRPHQEHDTDDSKTLKRRQGRKFRLEWLSTWPFFVYDQSSGTACKMQVC